MRFAYLCSLAMVLASTCCLPVAQAIERPGDARNASELRQRTLSVTPIQRRLLALAESASHADQFELYRTYDDSMGTWIQVRFIRDLQDASMLVRSPSDERRIRTDLRDHARYALWEIEQNIAHIDAALAAGGRPDYLRLMRALRSELTRARATVARLAADACARPPCATPAGRARR